MNVELRGNSNRQVQLESTPVATGGEGGIYRIGGEDAKVVKVYHDNILSLRRSELEAKASVMTKNPPGDSGLCWPIEMAYAGGIFVGVSMPLLDVGRTLSWATLSNASTRRVKARTFGVAHAIRSCINAAAALQGAHSIGVVLGDVNESNILIYSDSKVSVVDCDSAQVVSNGKVLHCLVGKADYLAPELYGANFSDKDRTSSSDIFAFAVLVFQMLTGGAHPYDGVPIDVNSDLPPIQERIRDYLCPYFSEEARRRIGVPARVPFGAIDRRIKDLLFSSLLLSENERPGADEWYRVLVGVDQSLRACDVVSTHAYDKNLSECPWCVHRSVSGSDPFGPVALRQVSLDEIVFSPDAAFAKGPVVSSATGYASPGGPVAVGSPSAPAQSGTYYESSSWFDLSLKHPGAVITHVSVKNPLLLKLWAAPVTKRISIYFSTLISLGIGVLWWAILLTGLKVASNSVSGNEHALFKLVTLIVLLGGFLGSVVLGLIFIIGTHRVRGLRRSSGVSNALRLGFLVGPGGVCVVVVGVMWAIYRAIMHLAHYATRWG